MPLIDGGYMVGGHLSRVNGLSVSHVVRRNFRGSLDSSFSDEIVGSSVQSVLELTGGGYLIGGKFERMNGATVSANLVRLDSSGRLDSAFNANLGAGLNSYVYSVASTADEGYLIGGAFTRLDEVQVGRVARLESRGNLDTGFNNSLRQAVP